jgi:hypothetical protein
MTLIVSFTGQPFAAIASDRLVTLADQRTGRYVGDHDTRANKIIVAILPDALVCIGYTGNAYIGTSPTDEWIVEVVAPNSGIFEGGTASSYGFRRPSRLRLHQICNRLRQRLSSVPGGDGILVHICGWRQRRNKMYRFSAKLKAETTLQKSKDLILKPVFPLDPLLSHVGASISCDDLNQAAVKSGFNPSLVYPDAARDLLTALIRCVSSKNKTVGQDVMSVVLMHPSEKRILCRFDKTKIFFGSIHDQQQVYRLPVDFNPWIITPNGFIAPQETTSGGEGSEIYEFDGWTIEIDSRGGGPIPASNMHWSRPQQRARRPGTRGA